MSIFSTIIIFSLLITPSIHANEILTSEESNLIDFSYPSHGCGEKTKKPIKVARFKTFEDVNDYNSAIVDYNIKVASYNKEIKKYKLCINQYIKNGNNDIDIIKSALKKALKNARDK